MNAKDGQRAKPLWKETSWLESFDAWARSCELLCLSSCCVRLFQWLHTPNTMYKYNYKYKGIYLSGVSEWCYVLVLYI